MECADMSALWNDATFRVVGKRQRDAAVQIFKSRAVALESLAEFLLKRNK